LQNTRRKSRSRSLGIAVGLLCSGAALVWLYSSIEKDQIFAHVRGVRIENLVFAILLTCLSYLLRSWRWPFFFSEPCLSFGNSFRCLIVGFFMNNTLPARMGELVRAHLGGKAAGRSRTTVLATIAGERVVDGLAISVIFAALFSLGARPQELQQATGLYFVALFFALASAGLVVVIAFRNPIFSLLERLSEKVSGKLSNFTIVRIRRFIEGLEPMLRPVKLLQILAMSFVIWFIELAVYWQVGLAFRQELSIGATSLFLAAVNFSSLIPAAPAGIGVIELFSTAALTKVGVDREAALAMVASQHIIQIAVVGIPGAFLFFSKLGGKIPHPAEARPGATEELNSVPN